MARFFGAGKEKPNLKQLGLYALLSYGFVSNASYSICVAIAWFASSKKSGVEACSCAGSFFSEEVFLCTGLLPEEPPTAILHIRTVCCHAKNRTVGVPFGLYNGYTIVYTMVYAI